MGLDARILYLLTLSFKPVFSLSSLTLIKRLFSSSSLSAIRVASSVYLRLLILIPAWDSRSLAFCMMNSAYKLNKQDGHIQPWHAPFPILTKSIVPRPVLTVASWPTYRVQFLRRQVRWSDIPISIRIFHSLLWFSIVNEAEVDVFLKFPCFLYDPMTTVY